MIVVLGHLLIEPLSEHEISSMLWVAFEFPDFVRVLPCRKPLANVQVLSHLLTWYWVGVNWRLTTSQRGLLELIHECTTRVTWENCSELMWQTSEHQCSSLFHKWASMQELTWWTSNHQGTIFLSATGEDWGDCVDGHAAKYNFYGASSVDQDLVQTR